ncbi:hypothetical protein [Novosphingobium colocasiae]|uniref:hypothetical protein n=1 Tax=Novosphingobium colocasiae TaxID=1256513 RepID=UPI0035B1C3DB
MNRLKIAALTAAALCGAGLLATTSFAHGSMKPMHGGKVQMSGETLFEIVKGPKGVDVYISEEDEPLPAKDFTGKLIVTAGSQKTTSPLAVTGANKFSVAGLKPAAGAKVVVSLVEKASGSKTFATFTL